MFLTTYKEAREQLEQSQNPIFLYDNDADGLCSFLLLRRWLGRGTGVAVRSYPDVSSQHLEKINKENIDCVVVLDRHSLSEELLKGVQEKGLNVVWIDHHESNDVERYGKLDFVFYFNSRYTLKTKNSKPVAFHSLQIANVENDAWIALVGCISDAHMPIFSKNVVKQYPDLWSKKIKSAFDAYYKTDFGRIALAINFGLKDSAAKVVEMQDFLLHCRDPKEALNESEENALLRENTRELMKKYLILVEKARESLKGDTLFFVYGGATSMSSEISNALMYEFPKKYIGVAFKKGGIVNVSLRGKDVKKILEGILPVIENSAGGGHPNAVGARIPASSLNKFEELFRKAAEGFK